MAIRTLAHVLRGLGATAFLSVVLGANAPLTIDGTSIEAFDRSHMALIASLAPPDRVRLALLESSLLACHSPVAQTDSKTVVPALPPISSIREKLNGLTYPQIAKLAKRSGCKVNVGFVTDSPSNYRIERTRDTSSAK